MQVHFAPFKFVVALISLLRGLGRWAGKGLQLLAKLCGRVPALSRSAEIAPWPTRRRRRRHSVGQPRCHACGSACTLRSSVDDPHVNLRITM